MKAHLSASEIEQYNDRRLTATDLLRVDDHLASCANCRQMAAGSGAEAVDCDSLFNGAAEPPFHLDYAEIEAYVDGSPTAADREIVESHVEMCGRCREEIRDLRAFRAELSTFPVVAVSAIGPRQTRERAAAWWRRASFFVPLSAASGAAAAFALVMVTVARPLTERVSTARSDLARASRENERLAETSNALGRQAASVSGLEKRVAALQGNVDLFRKENQALKTARSSRSVQAGDHGPTQMALNDGGGRVYVDARGHAVRMESLPGGADLALRTALVDVPRNIVALAGRQGQLMGSGDDTGFAALGPKAVAVLSDRPTFRWRVLKNATRYVVSVYDEAGNETAKSGDETGTSWTPAQPLRRGATYQWEIVAFRGDDEIDKAPKPPAPSAKIIVLDARKADEIDRARRQYEGSHLALGAAYASAGMLDDAEAEFKALQSKNPAAPVARKLLERIHAIRNGAK